MADEVSVPATGLFKQHFHWQVLLRWEVFGWILASMIAVAGLLLFFDEYWGANFCFMLTAIFLFAKVAALAIDSADPLWHRLAFTFLLFGLIGVGIVETVKGVNATRASHTPAPPSTVIESLGYSLKLLNTRESTLFLNEPLEPDHSFYRFQIANTGGDAISDIRVALDLPALLARQPIVIDHSFTDNLTVKPVFAAYTRTPPGGKTERISGLSNAVIVEISRLRQSGMIDLGFVTAPIKERRAIVATAPDGSIVLGVAPIYGRYGSVSIRRPVTRAGKTAIEMKSFPVNHPTLNTELIDISRPLRPESRSVLFLMTQDEMIKAINDHVDIQMEHHFQ